jgi:DNA-binding HxlR family transcriptional regulator
MVAVETSPGKGVRTGARVLALLAVPLNGLIVHSLGNGPMRQSDLHRELGNPAQTTLRGHLAKLKALGAVRRQMNGDRAHVVENELTDKGEELLVVIESLAVWLARSPGGPVPLGSEQAKGAVKALAGAWESTVLCTLARAPLSLTQLDRLIGPLSYPALERRLAAMRATGLVEEVKGGDGRSHSVTAWARRGVGPIAAAARFERLFMEAETPPLEPADVEAAFLLATPIADLPENADGVCSLAAETGDGDARRFAGVEVAVSRGQVVSCTARVNGSPRNWVLGTAPAWLEAVVHHRPESLRIGGDRHLARGLVRGLHELLFASNRTARAQICGE